MKVVRIITRLNVGGPARHAVWLTSRLNRRGAETVLVSGRVPPGEHDMHYFATANDVEPLYINGLSRELSLSDLVATFRIYNILRKEGPQIVHTHTAKAGFVGRIAAFVYRWCTFGALIGRPRAIRIVHTFHGNIFRGYYGPTKTTVFKVIERILARFATDSIVILSDQQLDEINEGAKIGRREQFRIIPLGMDLSEFENIDRTRSLRQEIGAGDDDIIVAFLGRLTEIKDVPLLLDAFCEHRNAESETRMQLAVIGDGNLRKDLEKQATDSGTADTVHFLGNRRDTAQLLAEADIVALTSLNEGTPLSLIEAMAAGTPVMSTMVGGVVNLFGRRIRQENGFVVFERGIGIEDRDPKHFLNGLLYLAANDDARADLAAAAAEYVHMQHSLDRLDRDVNALYSELLLNA